MTNALTFGNSWELLRQLGYVPVPLSESGQPLGPVFVHQLDHSKLEASNPLPVGVLTWVPAPRGEFDPIKDPVAIRLATLTVKVRADLMSDVDAIVAKHTGKARRLVRIEDDGSMRIPFRLTDEPFPTVQTSTANDPGHAVIETGPSWIPLDGNWRDGMYPTDVPRSELPEMTRDVADALVKKLDALFEARAPRWEPPVYVRRPILEPGARLLYGNQRALNQLRENGWPDLLPVRWGHQQVERDGYMMTQLDKFKYNVDVSSHGVGFMLKGLVTIETISPWRPDVDAIIRDLGPCLVRSVAGDESRRLHLFRSQYNGSDQALYSPFVNMAVRRTGLLVLSGADENGHAYAWDSDLLQAKLSELATFDAWDVQKVQRALEPLPRIKSSRRGAVA